MHRTRSFKDQRLERMRYLRKASKVKDLALIEMPKISSFPLKNARDFTCARLNGLGFDTSCLKLDFSDKSIEYIKHIRLKEASSPPLARPSRSNWSLARRIWQEPMPLFLEIGSFILNRSTDHIASKIFIVEKKISSRLSAG